MNLSQIHSKEIAVLLFKWHYAKGVSILVDERIENDNFVDIPKIQTLYSHSTESLMYLIICTILDIGFVVCRLFQFM